jgi:hypothetical protein
VDGQCPDSEFPQRPPLTKPTGSEQFPGYKERHHFHTTAAAAATTIERKT